MATKVITTFLALILTLNNFIFNSIKYLQTKGSAMGTICALSICQYIYGSFLEKTHIPIYQRALINLSLIY